MKTIFQDVEAFHRACDVPVLTVPDFPSHDRAVLRVDLMLEEGKETLLAMLRGDLIEIADGMADLAYVTVGTALEFGLTLNMPPRNPRGHAPALPERSSTSAYVADLMGYLGEVAFGVSARSIIGTRNALIDVLWWVEAASTAYGIPIDAVLAEVHAANMRKVDLGTGKVRRRADGKILKPEGWTPPDIARVLGLSPREVAA